MRIGRPWKYEREISGAAFEKCVERHLSRTREIAEGGTAFVQDTVLLYVCGWKAGSEMGNGLEPVFPWPHLEFTMKTLFQKLLAALLRKAMSNRPYWTQCEFQFSKRVLERRQR